jgi:HSP20 family protein
MGRQTKSTPVSIHHRGNPFLTLQEEFDKAINRMYDFENLNINPAIDIVDDGKTFKIEAEMPGLDEKDIKVSIEDGVLKIHGEKEVSKKDENKNYLMREIGYGRYERMISLPESADIEKAKATFKKGMLWIEIPKKADASKKSRDLKIEKAH